MKDSDFSALLKGIAAADARGIRPSYGKQTQGEEHMTDLTEKNLEATLLNLTKTGRPIAIKPTTWFGNPAKTAQWYTCPNCAKQSPLTLEWVSLTDDELLKTYGWQFESYGQSDRPSSLGQSIVDEAKQEIIDGLRKVEAKLKEKNL